MYKEHPVFEKANDDDIIWRYLDFTKFVSMLDKRALFFIRADKLDDTFEGSFSKGNIKLRPIVYGDKIPKDVLSKLSNIWKENRKYMLINSWHISRYESAAMWKLYLKSNEGVAIKSTFKRLCDSFNNYTDDVISIGKIKYIDYENEWIPEGNSFYPFLHKRKSFEYEQELRAILHRLPLKEDEIVLGEELFECGLNVPVELDILVEKIFLSPTAPGWFYELVKSIANKFNFDKEIVQSNLNEDPVY